MSDQERSEAGNPILRHTEEAAPADGVAHADDERISDHIERVLGDGGMVFHEIVSDRVHMDVHTVPATEERPFQMIITSGMSALPMNVPAELDEGSDWQHAELCMLLPADWPMEQESFKDERNYWPVRLVKQLGRLPHDFNTWLGWGHSIPNGDPAEPYAPGTKLTGAVIIPPFVLGEDLFVVPGDPVLHIFQVLPVTDAEMELKLRVGLDGMLEHLEEAIPDIYGPIDPGRDSAC